MSEKDKITELRADNGRQGVGVRGGPTMKEDKGTRGVVKPTYVLIVVVMPQLGALVKNLQNCIPEKMNFTVCK